MLNRVLNLEDKEFYGRIWAIALPIALQNLINFGVSMMDTLMVGKLGEIELSAASAANQMTFMFVVLSFGIANGCSVLSAQYWGGGNRDRVCQTMAFMYRMVLVLSVVFTGVAFFFPEWVLRLFIPDAAVIAAGVVYLRIIALTFLFAGITNTTIGILRSVGSVNISLVIYSVSLVVNTTLNYGLIFGKLGFPRLGIAGAAIATVIARMVECIIAVTYLLRFERQIAPRFAELLRIEPSLTAGIVRFAAPVLLNEVLWTTGALVIAAIIGHMGREVLAANSICQVLVQLSHGVLFGLSNAAATIIGNTIGQGEYVLTRRRANAFLAIGVLMGFVCAAALYAASFPLISFYKGSLSALAIDYAREMSVVVSAMSIPLTVSMVGMIGVLRGGGDTRFVMFADLIFLWMICIPLGAYCGLVLRLPVAITYFVLKSEDILKALIVGVRIAGGRWLRDVTR